MAIEYKDVFVTRAIAKQLLESNVEYNRGTKSVKVGQYAADMREGNWLGESGETIKVTPEGKMIDGANRMRALLESGKKGVWMTIAYGVPERAIHVVDTGAAKTFADVLKMTHADDTSGRFVNGALVKRIYLWERGHHFQGRGARKIAPTHSQLIERYTKDRTRFDSASQRGKDVGRLSQASTAGHVFYLFEEINHGQAMNFFDMVISGANLTERHPALTLRDRLMRRAKDPLSPDEQVAAWIRAWNAFRDDRTLAQVYPGATSQGELTNLNFPTPK